MDLQFRLDVGFQLKTHPRDLNYRKIKTKTFFYKSAESVGAARLKKRQKLCFNRLKRATDFK